MTTYYTLLTTIGQAKIANAIALGQNVSWTDMAVGDGNGNPTTPRESQTALVREVYRAGINQLTVDPDNPNYMASELVIPTNVGGWAVNEVGIFDADGDLVAVANFPATYKPQLEEGSGRDLVVRIIVQVSNASIVTLKVDPAIVLASQKWVVDNFVKKITVAGGTTGQVLAKQSNANEDFKWIDPTASEVERGFIMLASGVETKEGVNSTKAVTPSSLNERTATETMTGLIEIATAAEAQALTDDQRAITPKKLGDAMNSHVLGVGQSWQNVKASRTRQTNYTNTTGRTIGVYITFTEGGSANYNAISVDGIPIGFSSGTGGMSNFFLVQPGSVYRTNTTTKLETWSELR